MAVLSRLCETAMYNCLDALCPLSVTPFSLGSPGVQRVGKITESNDMAGKLHTSVMLQENITIKRFRPSRPARLVRFYSMLIRGESSPSKSKMNRIVKWISRTGYRPVYNRKWDTRFTGNGTRVILKGHGTKNIGNKFPKQNRKCYNTVIYNFVSSSSGLHSFSLRTRKTQSLE